MTAVTQNGPGGETLLAAVLDLLSDMKAEDIVQVDLRGNFLSAITW